MIDQYRSKHPFIITLNTFEECNNENDLTTCENATCDAVPTSTSTHPVITKRKISLLEYKRTEHRKNQDIVVMLKGVMLLLSLH